MTPEPAPVLTFASAKAGPGVTTTAVLVAAAWPGDGLLIEADDSGGVLAARLGLSECPSALHLAGAARSDLDLALLRSHCQQVGDGLAVLVAPAEPQQVVATHRELAPTLAELFAGAHTAAIIDGGRLTPTSSVWPVSRHGLVVLLARNRLEEFTALAAAARELRAARAKVVAVIVDDGAYPPEEFADKAGVELVGVVPFDAAAAAALQGGPSSRRGLARSRLWSAELELADRLVTMLAAMSSPMHAYDNAPHADVLR